VSDLVEGVMGNREVPRIEILGLRAHQRGALPEATTEEEGGSWRKHGFPHATEPQAKEEVR
jgi:hypothetical protein